ncbi:MAG: ferritin family protein [candidate division WOR-3 bacterium]
MATFYSPAEVIAAAVQTEQAGQEYYRTLAQGTMLAASKELFGFLAQEEASHERTFAALHAKFKTGPELLPYDWEEVVAYLKVLTASRFFLGPDKALSLAHSAQDEREALEFALQFEKDTLLFYLEIEQLVAPEDRSVVREIASQERRHIRRLSELQTQTS